MPAVAIALVLAAAVAHAGWNLLAKGVAGGGVAFVWSYGAAGLVIWAPLGIGLLLVHPVPVEPVALGLMAGSGALHAAYFVLLQRGYASGDLSLVYPLARGAGPLLAVPLAVLVLAERPGPIGLLGATVIVLAILSLTGRPQGRAGTAVGYALGTGLLIAAYTVWDAHAVQQLPVAVVTY